ncbi:hypothetical protein B296_00034024 [Ensete ventricosum]|uniref:Uncharacterized protein n=1 Tax=Ensete ventricosum TaxID=4639 RepID=A0A426ZAV5_ENSVE|nr:hypothetical protein B296_00034024 [Ensete ventricosum]
MTAHNGFRVGGSPPSNKGWKSHLFFISCHRGWSFPTKWTSRMVNNSVPALSANKTELVEILRGILSASGVKDMNEAWLAEMGLSPAPRGMFFLFVHYTSFFLIVPYRVEMFNLEKMKSDNGAISGSMVPSTISASTIVDVTSSMVEKLPSTDEGASLGKRSRKVTPEQPTDASGSTTRAPAKKGNESMEVDEAPERGYTIRDLCEGLHFVIAECRAKKLEEHVEKLRAKLESLKNQQKGLNQEVGILRSSYNGARDYRVRLEGDVLSLTEATMLLEVELKVKGPKAVDAFKVSRGFKSGLEKMGQDNYEFGHRVVLAWLQGKHMEIEIE